jgi:DNA-binding response OmpR family regulator
MDGPTRADGCYVFERCRLDPVSRTLTRDGQKVPLQGRLFDVCCTWCTMPAGWCCARNC